MDSQRARTPVPSEPPLGELERTPRSTSASLAGTRLKGMLATLTVQNVASLTMNTQEFGTRTSPCGILQVARIGWYSFLVCGLFA